MIHIDERLDKSHTLKEKVESVKKHHSRTTIEIITTTNWSLNEHAKENCLDNKKYSFKEKKKENRTIKEIIEDCKPILLEEAEKLYNCTVDRFVCEVVNENVSKQSSAAYHLSYH